MKKKLIYFIIIIVCLIPSALAVKYYSDAVGAPASARTALSVTVDDIDGNSYTTEKAQDPDELENVITFFLDMNSRAAKVPALPDSVASQKCFRVNIKTPTRDESYQYYITTPSLCYLVTPEGATYQLTEADGTAFLKTKYAECLFDGARMPVLTVSADSSASPREASWNFRGYDEEFTAADTSKIVSSEAQAFNAVGGLSLDFDIEPDLCSVVIEDESGAEIFNNTLEDLPSLRIEEDVKVSVRVSASWYEDPSREYYGEMKYEFTASVTAPAIFYAMKPEASAGDVIAISAKRVSDPSKIGFESSPALGTSPVFYSDGELSHALMAIPTDAQAGEYTLRFTYGGASQEINLAITESKRSDAYITVTAQVLSASYTDEAIAEFTNLAKELSSEVSETRLFDGAFGTGVGDDALLKRGFGRRVIINNDVTESYINMGVDYVAQTGYEITSAAGGRVIFTGSTAYTGNLVVIEHGYGLKTWYWNLSEISVAIGDTVASGDVVGKAGTSGFNGGESGVHVAMSVGADFVCPYDTWSDGDGGILMYGVLENKNS